MSEFSRKLKWLFQRSSKEKELEEELRFHLEEEAEEGLTTGKLEREALLAAQRSLGNLTLLREQTRSAWGWSPVEDLVQDLRYAFRTIAGNKLFSALASLSLALGIGANTAIYSFMDSILSRTLPVGRPESLVMLKWVAKQPADWGTFVMHSINGSTYDEGGGTNAGIFPYPAFETFQASGVDVFSSLFAYHQTPRLNVAAKGQAYLAAGEYVSGDFFRGLGVPPASGRLLIASDDGFGADPVVVISEAFGRKCFGGADSAIGQKVLINNALFTVVGVTTPEFFGVDPSVNPDVFLPVHSNVVVEASSQFGGQSAEYLDNNYYWLDVMGRLKPGVTLEQAQTTLGPVFANWVATTASTDAERSNLPALKVEPGAGGLETLRRQYSRPLYVLMTLVGLILTIACANVANLLLARISVRRREIALRLSIGAGRLRIVRQLLTESVLLSSIGGMLGVFFAVWGIRFLTLMLAKGSASFTLRAELNWHVLSLALALSMLTGVAFGLAPALQATRVDLVTAMKETRAGGSVAHSHWRFRLGHVLIVGQIAMSLLMLVAAGLFVRTLSNLQSIDVGFNRENLLIFNLNARQAGRPIKEIADLYASLLQQFKAIPGVRQASLANQSFISAGFGLNHHIPGKAMNPADRMLIVGPDYFKTMQIPIVAGREIGESDLPISQPVAMISEYFAKVNFQGENPIGKHVVLRGQRDRKEAERDMEIVGVAKDAKYGGITDRLRPVLYIPYNQGYPEPEEVFFQLRTAGDPLAFINTVREIVRRVDSRMPVGGVETESAAIEHTINQEIVFARLCTGFALLALVIACVGLYGIVSYSVAQRTEEIGIRMALGAQRGRLLTMILRQVGILTALGLAIGLLGSLAASRLVKTFLFGMRPNDPLTIVGAALTLVVAAVLACYAPARRASTIDPMVALRHE
jgi:macrolide transport system ATP-binding/permease protein